MDFVYADNAATTKISDHVLSAMMPYLKNEYGNASTVYKLGRSAHCAIEESRAIIAGHINARAKDIFFTSGASEANNWAIKGTAQKLKSLGKTHLITSNIEHHSVLNSFSRLEKEGFDVSYIKCDENGIVSPKDIAAAINENTGLVSVMYVNNELGTIQDIKEIGRICREAGVLFHCDAVQGAGILPIDVRAFNIDMLSVSAHKFHGPKGIGFLYAGKNSIPQTYIDGGQQEGGHRAGTENVAEIVGLATAFDDAYNEREEKYIKLERMRDFLQKELLKIPGSRVNGINAPRIPGTLNLSFPGTDGQSMLFELDLRGIAVSSGSACNSGNISPSHVLLALGLPYETAHGSIRISLGKYNTWEDVDKLIKDINAVVAK